MSGVVIDTYILAWPKSYETPTYRATEQFAGLAIAFTYVRFGGLDIDVTLALVVCPKVWSMAELPEHAHRVCR